MQTQHDKIIINIIEEFLLLLIKYCFKICFCEFLYEIAEDIINTISFAPIQSIRTFIRKRMYNCRDIRELLIGVDCILTNFKVHI